MTCVALSGRKMRLTNFKWLTQLCMMLPGICILASCTIADKTTFADKEGTLPETFFSDIRKGKTTASWIKSQLGEPETIQQGPDLQQIYNYRFSKVQKKHAGLLFLVRYDGIEREQHYFHVLLDNDIVKKYWNDDYLQVQGDKYFKKAKPVAPEQPEETEQSTPEGYNGQRQQIQAYNTRPLIEKAEDLEKLAPPAAGSTKPVDRSKLPPEANKKAPPYPQMKSPSELWPSNNLFK